MIVSARRRSAARRSGFTLLEVLVVVAILVILAGVASVSVFGIFDNSKVSTAATTCNTLEEACKVFVLTPGSNGNLPTTLRALVLPSDNGYQGMSATVEGGMSGITDPWGHEFQYTTMLYQGKTVPVVYSNGPPETNSPVYSRKTQGMMGN